MTVNFKGWHCAVVRAEYMNGVPALLLVDAQTGESVAKATVNLPDEKPISGHVFIKDWSENHGVMKALMRAGVIQKPSRVFPFNNVFVHECELTDAALELPVQGR